MKRFLFAALGLGCLILFVMQVHSVNADRTLFNSKDEPLVNNDGQLDPTFDDDGIVTTSIGGDSSSGNAVAIQSDGKIVIAGTTFDGIDGDISLARYLPDGTLDAAFGDNGKVRTDFNGRHDAANAIAIQADGRIVVVGSSYFQPQNEQDFVVVRYDADGELDTTFSNDGWVFTDMGANFDTAFDIAAQSDGKLVVAGVAENNGQGDMAVARYQTNGDLDTSFDSDGKVTTDLGSGFDWATGTAVQSDGKIVVAGFTHNGSNFDFAAVRYQANGALDPDFDSDGVVVTDIDGLYNQAYGMLVQSDGKIVAVGYSFSAIGNDNVATVVRYNANGSLDAGFGDNGVVMTPIGVTDSGYGVAQQTNGKLVVVGEHWNGTDTDIVLVRYLSNGEPDPDFGEDGVVITDIEGNHNRGTAVALQADGKIVAAGSFFVGDQEMMMLARYLSEPVAVAYGVYLPITRRE